MNNQNQFIDLAIWIYDFMSFGCLRNIAENLTFEMVDCELDCENAESYEPWALEVNQTLVFLSKDGKTARIEVWADIGCGGEQDIDMIECEVMPVDDVPFYFVGAQAAVEAMNRNLYLEYIKDKEILDEYAEAKQIDC